MCFTIISSTKITPITAEVKTVITNTDKKEKTRKYDRLNSGKYVSFLFVTNALRNGSDLSPLNWGRSFSSDSYPLVPGKWVRRV